MSTQGKKLGLVIALALACALGARAMLRDHAARARQAAQDSAQAQVLACGAHGARAPQGVVVSGPMGSVTLQLRPEGQTFEPNAAARTTRWRISAPIVAPADDAVVDAFVTAACSLASLGRIEARRGEPAVDLALFGLAVPRHQVTLVFDANSTSTLDVGDVSAYNNRLYVRRNHADGEAPAEQVDGAFVHHLTRDLHAWREKRPFVGLSPSDLERVDIALEGQAHWSIEATNPAGFKLSSSSGATLPGDSIKVRELLSALVGVRAEQFVADAVDDAARKRFQLYRPKNSVTLHCRGPGAPSRTLLLGRLKLGDQQHLFAQALGTDGPIMRLGAGDLWSRLQSGMQPLQDMRVVHADASAIEEVVVEHDSKVLHYHRTEATGAAPGLWHTDQGPPIDQEQFVGALHHLVQMRAASIVTRAADAQALQTGGLVVPKHTITLAAKGGRPLCILWLGRAAQGQRLITDDAKQIIWSVFEGTAERFTSDPQAFAAQPPPPAP